MEQEVLLAGEAAKHPTMHRRPLTTKNYPDQDVNRLRNLGVGKLGGYQAHPPAWWIRKPQSTEEYRLAP